MKAFEKITLSEDIQKKISKHFVQGKFIQYDFEIDNNMINYVNLYILSKCFFINDFDVFFITRHLVNNSGLIIKTGNIDGTLDIDIPESNILEISIIYDNINFAEMYTNDKNVYNKFTELKKLLYI